MNRWMRAGWLVVVIAGCGLGPVGEQPQAPEEPAAAHPKGQVQDPVAQVVLPPEQLTVSHQVPTQELKATPLERSEVKVQVALHGFTAAEGKHLRVVLGQMGCGFSPFAHGTVLVHEGSAELLLSQIPTHQTIDVFVFNDVDGNGQCTAADTLWMGTLVTEGVDVTLKLEQGELGAGPEWMCFAFQ